MKNKSKPQIAFLFLMIPVLFLVTTVLFGVLASILEQPLNRDGLYTVFATISILLMLTAPAVFTACSIISFVFQIMVYKSEGLRIRTFLMTVASLAYAVASIFYAQQMWISMMSV